MNESESADELWVPPRDAGSDYPDADQSVSPDFFEWRSDLPSLMIDGERFYLPTGDIPMDDSEVADYWHRLNASNPRAPGSLD